MNDKDYIAYALKLAKKAYDMGEVPVGAIVVRDSDGAIIGEGYNEREAARSPIAHAEITAITKACDLLGGWRLDNCTLYVTLEPCPMCAGAIVNARLKKVVFGAYDSKNGCCGSVLDILSIKGGYNPTYEGGIMEQECADMLKNFFKERRAKSMDNIKLIQAKTDTQLYRIENIAKEIWAEAFASLISKEQIEYMLERFCSYKAMCENIANDSYIYYIISRNGNDIGYTAIKLDDNRLFLSKIYIYSQYRGKGYSKKVIDIHKDFCKSNNLDAIWLTVNKGNERAIFAYEKIGFKKIGEGVADIGNGFVMDDYYYQLDI